MNLFWHVLSLFLSYLEGHVKNWNGVHILLGNTKFLTFFPQTCQNLLWAENLITKAAGLQTHNENQTQSDTVYFAYQ